MTHLKSRPRHGGPLHPHVIGETCWRWRTPPLAARKSRLHNALEGLALTATLQSFPTFAAAAMLLKLFGNLDLVGDPGVAIFVVAFASLAHALLAVTFRSEETSWLFQDRGTSRNSSRTPPVALRQDHRMARTQPVAPRFSS